MINAVKLLTKEAFGPKLKYLRKRARLTQTALAKLIGVKAATISRWEQSLMLPEDSTYCRVCEFFDKDYDYFTEEETSKEAAALEAMQDAVIKEDRMFMKNLVEQGEKDDAILRSEAVFHFMSRTARLMLENEQLKKNVAELEKKLAQAIGTKAPEIPKPVREATLLDDPWLKEVARIPKHLRYHLAPGMAAAQDVMKESDRNENDQGKKPQG